MALASSLDPELAYTLLSLLGPQVSKSFIYQINYLAYLTVLNLSYTLHSLLDLKLANTPPGSIDPYI